MGKRGINNLRGNACVLTARKQDSQDELTKGPLESVVEGYIFPNNISRLQQQTHNRMNPRLKNR